MMGLEMGKKELQILHELETNARQGMAGIAKKVRAGKERVSYAISRLEEKGIIRGYYTLIDHCALGRRCYRIYIKQKELNPQITGKFILFAKRNPHVWAFGRTSGEFNFTMGLWTRDVFEFGEIVDDVLGKFGEDIGEFATQAMTEYSEYTREYLTNEPKRAFRTLRKREVAKFDAVDIEVLGILSKDARIPTTKIAGKLGLTERVVRYRIRRMEKEGIIIAYRCNVGYGELGREYYKVDLYLNNREKMEEIRRHVCSLAETTYSEKTVYYADIEFDVEVGRHEDLIGIVQGVNAKFPGAIREFSYYTMLEFYK
jgi:DNA-binding Lrp family transcriptional regulator